MKKQSIVKQLEQKYGGKWKYTINYGWECLDKDMHGIKFHQCGYGIDGEPLPMNNIFKKLQPISIFEKDKRIDEFYPKF